MRTYLDRGGTFTDVVHLDGKRMDVQKVPSDRAVAGKLAKGPLTLGTTVATNALLEGRHAKTLLIVSEGFADLCHIGDMTRPSLFEPEKLWPKPLVDEVFEVPGRMNTQGVEIVPLILPDLDFCDIESVAIALLHSPQNPHHELTLAKHFHRTHPHLFISLGHEQSPGAGYLARIQTTLLDAAVSPILRSALDRDGLPPGSLAIRSDGGLCMAEDLRAPDAVLSGPAGGVLGVMAVAAQGGFQKAIGLDMGGTSTDVCRVDSGASVRVEGGFRVGGVLITRPALEVETIAAGGGSILASNGLQLSVGPESAGADPGPQCYRRGGPPTLTDAALSLGRINPEDFTPPLDPHAVNLPGSADDFLAIAHDSMAAAIRRIATSRGVSLEEHALVAYGGAAGQHAAEVAEQVGISTVLIHPCAAVLSAWGQQFAVREEQRSQAVWRPLNAMEPIRQIWKELDRKLPSFDQASYGLDLRCEGTETAIHLDTKFDITVDSARQRFFSEHQRRYGYSDPNATIEVVNVSCTRSEISRASIAKPRQSWSLPHPRVTGPTSLFLPTTAVHVPEGWNAEVRNGLLVLEHQNPKHATMSTERTPLNATLWASRFMSIAEQAGEVLARTARSTNIRQRKDYSCAIFDEKGYLVANAPHIPVHLGAMGETVRDLIRYTPEAAFDGTQSWLTNAPCAGGSHLPDLTVITPVPIGTTRVFVASRAHHVDVGGLTPGSMPSHSKSLKDEGIVFIREPLIAQGQRRDLGHLLRASRAPSTVQADLAAQLAANRHAALAIQRISSPEATLAWMAHLQNLSSDAASRVIAVMQPGHAQDSLDGLPLKLTLAPIGDRLNIRLEAPTQPHPGNLNTPTAVVRAAILYGLRVLAGSALPLNDGVLKHVHLELVEGSIFIPPTDAAVAGGNVETSQRLVDLFLVAAGYMASSLGTMNNLTLGGADWAYYETIGGGQGALPTSDGASGRQCHMTNTKATDVEILERLYPLRVHRMALRAGSAGDGLKNGGMGLVREIEVLTDTTASLLACWRPKGAPGINGGGHGATGEAWVLKSNTWTRWHGEPISLQPGERIQIKTPGGGAWGKK